MNKIREIARLAETQLSERSIARALNISRPVVGRYLAGIRILGLSYEQIKDK